MDSAGGRPTGSGSNSSGYYSNRRQVSGGSGRGKVRARGLPYSTTVTEVVEFFEKFNVSYCIQCILGVYS